jgi:hypothetical protein
VAEAPSKSEGKSGGLSNRTIDKSRSGRPSRFLLPYAGAALAVVGLSVLRVNSISIAPASEHPASDGAALTVYGCNNSLTWCEASDPASPKPPDARRSRVRLGDVVSASSKAAAFAALWDDRYTITPASTNSTSSRPPPAASEADSFIRKIGMLPDQNPPAKQKFAAPKLPNVAPPQFQYAPNAAAPNQGAYPEQKRLPDLKQAPETNLPLAAPPKPGSSVAPQVVVSATMMALLNAEALGTSAVECKGWDASADGISRVWHHLGSLHAIYDPGNAHAAFPRNLVEAFVSYFVTPLPFPGGSAFTQPEHLDLDKAPANTADLFNPAFSVSEPITVLPAIVFVALSAFGFAVGRRRRNANLLEMDPLGAGAVSVTMMFIMLVLTRDLWRQLPDSWIATVPGLMFVAIAGNGLELWIRAALRAGAATKRAEAAPDNALRSVLYRDAPIDDVARDRLGFQVLVSALRRFLDNPDTVPPVVVSINGPWGSGKSSVMKMLVRELRKTGRFQTAWFNAWQYHEEVQILPAFLSTIARELAAQRKFGFSLRLAWARAKRFSFWQYLVIMLFAAFVIVGFWTLKSQSQSMPPVHSVPALAFGKLWTRLTNGDPLENLAKLITLIGAVGGGLAGAWTVLSAFRLRFAKLFAVEDGPRAALIDDFAREFTLYREAVGTGKFLFVVDDLDRCPPDKVIAVLKAINLIVTSADEGNRSFFVFGFDQEYIIHSIEQHFRNLAPEGFERTSQFGQEYLKKMVTLSVSVPKPQPEKMRDLLDEIDTDAGGASQVLELPKRSLIETVAARVQTIPPWGWRLAAAVTCAAMLAIVVAGTLTPHSVKQATVTVSEATQASILNAGQNVIVMPQIFETSGRPKWWLWGIPGVMMVLMAGFLFRSTRPSILESSYLREPHDSEKFSRAVDQCMDFLPTNPRDLVRTINLMRMEYLLQTSPQAPFSGTPLSEWECVSYTLLQQRQPWMFASATLEGKVIPYLRSAKPPVKTDEFYSSISFDEHVGSDVARDIAKLQQKISKESNGAMLSHLIDPDKLQRYADLNRYSANGGYRLESRWQPEPPTDDAIRKPLAK